MNPQTLLPSNLENAFFIKMIRSRCSLQLRAGRWRSLKIARRAGRCVMPIDAASNDALPRRSLVELVGAFLFFYCIPLSFKCTTRLSLA